MRGKLTADSGTADPGTADPAASGGRYSLTAQALHWGVALMMFAVVALAWVMTSLPRTDPSRGLYFTVHKSIGLTILALVAARIWWRSRHPAPPLSGAEPAWVVASARASHWLLYAILVLMPVSGYLLSAAGGHPISYFGLFTIPAWPEVAWLSEAAEWVHVTARWAVYALITLHVAATTYHVAVRRDGVLDRMLPEQATRA